MKPEKPSHVSEELWRQHLIWLGVTTGEVENNIEKYRKEDKKNNRRTHY